MSSKLKLYLKFIKHLFLFYFRSNRITPASIFAIQQGFYHRIKGLLDKKILPYSYRVAKGEDSFEHSLVGAVVELNQIFDENLDVIFNNLPTTRKLLALLNAERKLNEAAIEGDIKAITLSLPEFREQSERVFVQDCGQLGFEFGNLLKYVNRGVLNDYKEPIRINKIKMHSRISRSKTLIWIPFKDVAMWQDILRNFIVNGIEACEGRTGDDSVMVKYNPVPDSNLMRLEITDSGCGMDSETMSKFFKRGFTKGKSTGTGFGIVEEYLEFLNLRGKFQIDSSPDEGTRITIELNPQKIGEVGRAPIIYQRRNKLIRLSLLTFLLIILFFVVGGGRLLFPPINKADYCIAGFSPLLLVGNDNPDEFGSIILRTEAGNENKIDFSPSAIKIAHGDSVGPICIDIDGDKADEMVAVVEPEPSQRVSLAGIIECFGVKGELEWKYPIEYDSILATDLKDEFPYPFKGRAILSQMYVMDIDYDGKPEIVALANFPNGISKLVVLNGLGEAQQVYIHFGPVGIYEFAYHRQARPRPPVLVGINKLLGNRPVITRIDIKAGSYQGVPYPLPSDDIKPAYETYYVLERADSVGIINPRDEKDIKAPEFYNCFVIGKNENIYVFQINDGRLVITPVSLDNISVDYNKKMFKKWWDELLNDNIVSKPFSDKELLVLGKVYKWEYNRLEIIKEYNPSDPLTRLFRQCKTF